MNEIEIDLDGPLFNGPNRSAALRRFEVEASREVAYQARSEVGRILNARVQHPTPYYETQITAQRTPYGARTHDRGIVYGPWLEGTSERNRSTSFKGYHAFRIATVLTQAKVPVLVQATLARLIAELGG